MFHSWAEESARDALEEAVNEGDPARIARAFERYKNARSDETRELEGARRLEIDSDDMEPLPTQASFQAALISKDRDVIRKYLRGMVLTHGYTGRIFPSEPPATLCILHDAEAKLYEAAQDQVSEMDEEIANYSAAVEQHGNFIKDQLANLPSQASFCSRCNKYLPCPQNENGTCYVCGGDKFSRLSIEEQMKKERIEMDHSETGIKRDAEGNEYVPHGSRLRFERFIPPGFHPDDHEDLSAGFGRRTAAAVNEDPEIISVLKEALLENAKFRAEVRSLRGEVLSLTGVIRDETRNAMASARDEADDNSLPSTQSCV